MSTFESVLKNFTVTPNLDFDYSFTCYQGAPTSQYPVDMTGASAVLTIKDAQGDTLLTISSGHTTPATGIYFGGVEQDPTNGIVDIHIHSTDANYPWQYANYAMVLTTNALGEQQPLYGSFATVGNLP